MLFEQTSISFPNSLYIKKIDTAFDSTFVILYQKHADFFNPYGSYIMHFGKQIIFEYKLEYPVADFLTVGSDKLVYRQSEQLVLLNLRTKKEEKRVNFVKNYNQSLTYMFYFNSTRLISVSQVKWGQRGTLEYYDSDLNLVLFQSLQNDKNFTLDYQRLQKGNDSSMVIWMPQLSSSINLYVYWLQMLGNQYILQARTIKIKSTQNARYYRQIDSQHLIGIYSSVGNKKSWKKNFLVSFVDSSIKEYPCLIELEDKPTKVFFLKDVIYFTEIEQVFKQQSNLNNYFTKINTLDMNIVAMENIKKGQIIQTFIPTDESSFLKVELLQKNNTKYLFRKITLMEAKDQYMHMLLHINEDFDDDLVLDTLRLLVLEDNF